LNAIFIIFQKKLLDRVKFACLNNLTVVIIDFQFHLRAFNDLVFLSILDLILLNNFLKNDIQAFFFEFFFLDFQLNSSTQKILNSNCVVQKNSTNGCQSDLKLQASIKKTYSPTLNAIIFQSVRSNFMKF